ncbi:MAG: LysR substrate-binding domain-containing protein [Beijerinckiaceae bacterium]
MNFRQLEIFRAVMVSGSATSAAKLLGITQPAVSRSIADLEQEAGFKLFERRRNRLAATHEASLLLAEVERSFVGLDQLRAEMARIRDFGTGTIRIASLAALGSTLVPRAIAAFQRKRADVAITLQVHSTARIRELVTNGSFDLGLVADEADLTGLDYRSFWTLGAVCAIPAGHRLAEKVTIGPADLANERFIALAPEDRARQRMETIFAETGIEPNVIVETPNSATICALALEGVGVGLVNPAATDGFAQRGLLLKPFEPTVTFKSILIFRPDRKDSLIVRQFIGELIRARGASTNWYRT